MSRSTRLWNVPNVISLSRMALAVAFVLISDTHTRIVLIAVAALTDLLDGLVARLADQRSTVGALLDPIADRLFVLAAVSAYLLSGLFGTGQYFIFISRDIATAVGFLVARIIPWLRPVTFRARLLGKAVTVLQLATLITVLLEPSATTGLIVAIGLLSAMSIFDYTLALWRARVR
ncbi:MAG TPA: CDP-alcohol phosphatidyltransferase family protein [Gemmatimonadaceae bacterium]